MDPVQLGGKHALAWTAMKALPRPTSPWPLMDGMKGWRGCHSSGSKPKKESQALRESRGQGLGWPHAMRATLVHTFSVKEAQQPQACQTCHMGFDHAHWKCTPPPSTGSDIFETERDSPGSAAAPTCQTCHMREGNHAVIDKLGFLAVRLPMPEDKKWAEARTTS